MTKSRSCLLVFYLIGFFAVRTYAATDPLQLIDSLKNEFKYEPADSVAGNLYLQLCYYFYVAEVMDSSCWYGLRGLEIAAIDNYPFLKAQLLEQTAIAYEFLDINKSIETYLLAIEAYTSAGHAKFVNEADLGGASNAHISLIMLYAKNGDIEKSLAHYRIADAMVKEEHPGTRAYLYEVMAYAQTTRKRFDLALEYEFKALKYYRESNSLSGIELKLAAIGNMYMKLMQYDSSRHYLRQALDMGGSHTRDRDKAEILVNLGNVNLELDHLERATYFYKEVETLRDQLNNPNQLSLINASLAEGYGRLGNYSKAIKYGEEAYQFATETKDLFAQQTALYGLQNAYIKNDNYRKASEALVTLLDVQDTLQSQENRKVLEELVQQYKAKGKQTQIDLQLVQISRQQTRLVTAVVIAMLLLALSLLSWRNIQQRKRTNDQLKALDRSKSRFFANISHELRTPLTLISAPLENALKSLKRQAHRDEIKLAHSNSKKLHGLINEIMDLSKLEAGKLELNERNVQLHSLLKRIFFSFQSIAQLQDIKIHFNYLLSEDLCVRLDVEKVEKVLNNLLSNAIKYNRSGGRVELVVRDSELQNRGRGERNLSYNRFLKLTVTDSGEGIHPDDIDHIFDRFYQGEQPGQPLQGGTGIGLALAKELSKLMGGDLTVLSNVAIDSESVGSTFTFILPLKVAQAKFKNEKQKKEGSSTTQERTNSTIASTIKDVDLPNVKNGGSSKDISYQPTILNADKPSILIVEDNAEMSKFLFQTLSPYYRCQAAMDGAQALSMIQKNNYDLITSDVMMPKMDGFTLVEQLNQIEAKRHTPVILLTARSLESDKLKGFQMGIDDYITKPFNIAELLARINNLLKNKFEREEWYEQLGDKETPTKPLTAEQQVLSKAEKIVENNLDKSSFKVGDLAREMTISERQLRRVLRKLTGLSPVDFISEIRLQSAYQMLESRQFATVSEVCYEVGFDRLPYFSWKFTERFGKNPSEMIG